MITVRTILLCLALLCFVLSALGVKPSGRLDLIAGGLGFWVAAQMVS